MAGLTKGKDKERKNNSENDVTVAYYSVLINNVQWLMVMFKLFA